MPQENSLLNIVSPEFSAAQFAAQQGAQVQEALSRPLQAYMQQSAQQEEMAVKTVTELLASARQNQDPDLESKLIQQITASPKALATFDRMGLTSLLQPVVKSKAQQQMDVLSKAKAQAQGSREGELAAETGPLGQEALRMKKQQEQVDRTQKLADIEAETEARLRATFKARNSPEAKQLVAEELAARIQLAKEKQDYANQQFVAQQEMQNQRIYLKDFNEKLDTLSSLKQDAQRMSFLQKTQPDQWASSLGNAYADTISSWARLSARSQQPLSDPASAAALGVSTKAEATPILLKAFKEMVRGTSRLSPAEQQGMRVIIANEAPVLSAALNWYMHDVKGNYENVKVKGANKQLLDPIGNAKDALGSASTAPELSTSYLLTPADKEDDFTPFGAY